MKIWFVLNMTLDEKELKKEKRKQIIKKRKEAKRLEEMKKNEEQKQKKTIPIKNKKIFIILIFIIIFIIIFLLIKAPLLNFINNAGRNDVSSIYLLLEDVTGYSEEDAISLLKNQGFVYIKREYIIDQFTEDNCVVKTNFHINSYLKPDEEIVLYICDKSLLNNELETESEQEVNDSYFTMDNISIVDMKIKDNTLYCIIRNDNSKAIKHILYKIGYQDESELSIGENKYDFDGIILPGEKQIISCEIKNKNAKYIYISGFSYSTIDVPENER